MDTHRTLAQYATCIYRWCNLVEVLPMPPHVYVLSMDVCPRDSRGDPSKQRLERLLIRGQHAFALRVPSESLRKA